MGADHRINPHWHRSTGCQLRVSFRDVRGESGLPPIPERLRQRREPTLRVTKDITPLAHADHRCSLIKIRLPPGRRNLRQLQRGENGAIGRHRTHLKWGNLFSRPRLRRRDGGDTVSSQRMSRRRGTWTGRIEPHRALARYYTTGVRYVLRRRHGHTRNAGLK
jgi:hypothetical protein